MASTTMQTLNKGVEKMANGVSGFAVKLGAGICNTFNEIKTESDNLKKAHLEKENKGVLDYVLDAANSVGRGGVSFLKGTYTLGKNIYNTEAVQNVKTGISDWYKNAREDIKTFLADEKENLAIDSENEMEANGHISFSTGFKSLMRSVWEKIDNVYEHGERSLKTATTYLGDTFDKLKKTDAYQKLVGARDSMDKEESAKQSTKETSKGL